MKYLILFSLLISTLSHAGVVTLPRGGKLSLSAKDWNVQETKGLTGVDVLLFGHKDLDNLQGFLLDGTVKEKGECTPGKTEICERVVPMGEKISYQIIGQRFIGKDTYQNYVLAFTIDKTQEEKLLPVLKKLRSQMEFTK